MPYWGFERIIWKIPFRISDYLLIYSFIQKILLPHTRQKHNLPYSGEMEIKKVSKITR